MRHLIYDELISFTTITITYFSINITAGASYIEILTACHQGSATLVHSYQGLPFVYFLFQC